MWFKGNSGKEAWKKVNGGGWTRGVAGGRTVVVVLVAGKLEAGSPMPCSP